MTAAPAGLRKYQTHDHPSKLMPSASKAAQKQRSNPALQRLQAKRDTGSLSAVEKKILHTLETQSAAQAQAAARAKAAINKAAQTDSVPLTSAQSKARFKCRAHAAEIAAAKARTDYLPEGPQAEEEATHESAQPTANNFKKRRLDSSHNSSRDFWDCYFHQNKRSVKRFKKQQHSQHPGASSDDDDDADHDEDDWAFMSDSDGCSDDYGEAEEENSAGNGQQQQPQSFYKQVDQLLSPAMAFHQLVQLVQGFSSRVKEHKAAAHLKGFVTKKVISKSDLASAARRVWLAVHPDRNKAPGAQEASQSLSTILTSFKKKGAL